jgi:hypothetical protein
MVSVMVSASMVRGGGLDMFSFLQGGFDCLIDDSLDVGLVGDVVSFFHVFIHLF